MNDEGDLTKIARAIDLINNLVKNNKDAGVKFLWPLAIAHDNLWDALKACESIDEALYEDILHQNKVKNNVAKGTVDGDSRGMEIPGYSI